MLLTTRCGPPGGNVKVALGVGVDGAVEVTLGVGVDGAAVEVALGVGVDGAVEVALGVAVDGAVAVGVGVSPTAYASERRLHNVADRLRNTSDPINQAAYAAGYGSESLSDFRREFRRRFGMSPTEYRSRYRNCHG